MRVVGVLLCTFLAFTGTLTGIAYSADADAPDPAPSAPQPPIESPVSGPTNIEQLFATVRSDHGAAGGFRVTLDRWSRTVTGEKPSAATRHVYLFDRSVQVNSTQFPTCGRVSLVEHGPGACPPDSLVGRGFNEPWVKAGDTPRRSRVLVFNARAVDGKPMLLMSIPDEGLVFERTWAEVVTPYDENYRLGAVSVVPPGDVLPSEREASSRFLITFGAMRTLDGKKLSFLQSSARPGSELKFGLWSRFVTGRQQLHEDSSCLVFPGA